MPGYRIKKKAIPGVAPKPPPKPPKKSTTPCKTGKAPTGAGNRCVKIKTKTPAQQGKLQYQKTGKRCAAGYSQAAKSGFGATLCNRRIAKDVITYPEGSIAAHFKKPKRKKK